MEQSTKEAWKRLLDEARRELPDATVRTWLEPAVPIALDDDRLIVGAPDQFAVEWNESKRSEEHTSELQSPDHLVCRLLLEKKKKIKKNRLRLHRLLCAQKANPLRASHPLDHRRAHVQSI